MAGRVAGMRVPWRGADLLPRASIGLGIAATVAMNVAAGSRGGLGGALLGVLPAAGLLLSLETLIWLVRRVAGRKDGLWWCLGAGVPLAALAGITGTVSYLHALTVARWTAAPGEVGAALTEHLIPLVADLMIATGSVALVALARNRARASAARPAASGRAEHAVPAGSRPVTRPASGELRPPGRRHPGRAAAPLPVPVSLEELAYLAATMTKRDLAAELSARAGQPNAVTVWKAEQIKKRHKAGQPLDRYVLAGSANGAGPGHVNGPVNGSAAGES